MANLIVSLILLCTVGGIVFYLYKSKKRGQTCIGCPYAKQCSGKCRSKKPVQS
ncbi:MAG: FeoB-associated Cys-rich membrane protein [Clostridia bacterium]|nr:FeoB-associated Cys-rich membrane protein [Clostridia bacterium]